MYAPNVPGKNKENLEWERIVRLANKLGDEDPLPASGETGRYVKYAMNAAGYYALPRGKGRRLHPHRNLRKLQIQKDLRHAAEQLFMVALQGKFKAAQAVAAETSPYVLAPLTQESVIEMQGWALTEADRLLTDRRRDIRRAANNRQHASRMINAGVFAGNANRAAHAGV